jgi:hypothetical protein
VSIKALDPRIHQIKLWLIGFFAYGSLTLFVFFPFSCALFWVFLWVIEEAEDEENIEIIE